MTRGDADAACPALDASDDPEIARASSATAPCGRVSASDRARVRGGCLGRIRGGRLDLSVATVAGSLPLATCDIAARVHVDARGRNWIDSIEISGRRCSGIRSCARGGRGRTWAGQFHRNIPGQVHDHVDVCLETPLGRVAGAITTT